MGRAPCCDKATVRKGPWSPEEDAALKSYIDEQGPVGNWIALPQKIGLNRCGKSCRLRWLNYLRPNIKHGGFSEEEDNFICSVYIAIGSRWSIIAAQLPGRTDNDIKNYWNTKLKKKLLGKQHNKEHHARRNNPKGDGMKKPSTKNENFSVVSGTANGWSEVPREVVSHLPPASMSQNPNYPIGSLASLQELLVQIGGRFSPNQEEELVPINTYNLHCPIGLVSPTYYPVERSTIAASSRPFNDIYFEGPPTTQYSTSKVDNVPVVFDDMLPDFSTGTEIYGQHIENIYSALETVNGSLCSSAASNPEGSSIIWEADTSSFLDGNKSPRPPLLFELEAQSRSLGGGIGTGDIIHLWRNRGCLWDTVNGILCDQPN